MKKAFIIFGLTVIFILASCNNPASQSSGSLSSAAFSVVSETKLLKSYGSPYIKGTVQNTGNRTGYNVSVNYTAYKNNVIIDTARGFPASLGSIPIGVQAIYEAIFFDLDSHNDYDRLAVSISFLNR